ncbi:hypothetical protein J8273_1571 [Carpediemonas membranifera]|uniref:Uncharacterized protein n=1 Tax=Carpediemonas membranifera TaxID=201153 RepID=A0A8J6E3Z1_9EUKA|nr:hypothetical protein J8273_1571 [Carpediemonas membranifera]|eukprot:KAG9396563.1 hypothetical protein J8273_1571 [Carpediemonas membranifera]
MTARRVRMSRRAVSSQQATALEPAPAKPVSVTTTDVEDAFASSQTDSNREFLMMPENITQHVRLLVTFIRKHPIVFEESKEFSVAIGVAIAMVKAIADADTRSKIFDSPRTINAIFDLCGLFDAGAVSTPDIPILISLLLHNLTIDPAAVQTIGDNEEEGWMDRIMSLIVKTLASTAFMAAGTLELTPQFPMKALQPRVAKLVEEFSPSGSAEFFCLTALQRLLQCSKPAMRAYLKVGVGSVLLGLMDLVSLIYTPGHAQPHVPIQPSLETVFVVKALCNVLEHITLQPFLKKRLLDSAVPDKKGRPQSRAVDRLLSCYYLVDDLGLAPPEEGPALTDQQVSILTGDVKRTILAVLVNFTKTSPSTRLQVLRSRLVTEFSEVLGVLSHSSRADSASQPFASQSLEAVASGHASLAGVRHGLALFVNISIDDLRCGKRLLHLLPMAVSIFTQPCDSEVRVFVGLFIMGLLPLRPDAVSEEVKAELVGIADSLIDRADVQADIYEISERLKMSIETLGDTPVDVESDPQSDSVSTDRIVSTLDESTLQASQEAGGLAMLPTKEFDAVSLEQLRGRFV